MVREAAVGARPFGQKAVGFAFSDEEHAIDRDGSEAARTDGGIERAPRASRSVGKLLDTVKFFPGRGGIVNMGTPPASG
jgi:hypothetical protein